MDDDDLTRQQQQQQRLSELLLLPVWRPEEPSAHWIGNGSTVAANDLRRRAGPTLHHPSSLSSTLLRPLRLYSPLV